MVSSPCNTVADSAYKLHLVPLQFLSYFSESHRLSCRRLGYAVVHNARRFERQFCTHSVTAKVASRYNSPPTPDIPILVRSPSVYTIHLRLLLFHARVEFRARAHSYIRSGESPAVGASICSQPLYPCSISHTCYVGCSAELRRSVSRIQNIDQPKWNLSVSGTCQTGCRYCTAAGRRLGHRPGAARPPVRRSDCRQMSGVIMAAGGRLNQRNSGTM